MQVVQALPAKGLPSSPLHSWLKSWHVQLLEDADIRPSTKRPPVAEAFVLALRPSHR